MTDRTEHPRLGAALKLADAYRPLRAEPLEEACIRLVGAQDGCGRTVNLGDGLDPNRVLDDAQRLITHLDRNSVHLDGGFHPTTSPDIQRDGRLAAIRNIKLLLDVLAEHVKAGNYP